MRTGDVTSNIMTVVNTAVVHLKVVERVDPESSHHKGKNPFLSFSVSIMR